MSRKLCNRCDGQFIGTGGRLSLDYGVVEIDANLCHDCYTDMVDAYKGGDSS